MTNRRGEVEVDTEDVGEDWNFEGMVSVDEVTVS